MENKDFYVWVKASERLPSVDKEVLWNETEEPPFWGTYTPINGTKNITIYESSGEEEIMEIDEKLKHLSWLEQLTLPFKECYVPVEEIVSDDELEKVWGSANFGNVSKRYVVLEALEKYTQGYQSGKTADSIVKELGLVSEKNYLTEKGLKYLLNGKKVTLPIKEQEYVIEKIKAEMKEASDAQDEHTDGTEENTYYLGKWNGLSVALHLLISTQNDERNASQQNLNQGTDAGLKKEQEDVEALAGKNK